MTIEYVTDVLVNRYASRSLPLKDAPLAKSANYTESVRQGGPRAISRKIFVSHSHLDVVLVNSVLKMLREFGMDGWVDWLDPAMPKQTAPETGARLKANIEESRRFIVIATVNSLQSKWVPWELGYADKALGLRNVCVLPVLLGAASGGWDRVEYMGLYPKLYHDTAGQLVVRLPDNSDIAFRVWLGVLFS